MVVAVMRKKRRNDRGSIRGSIRRSADQAAVKRVTNAAAVNAGVHADAMNQKRTHLNEGDADARRRSRRERARKRAPRNVALRRLALVEVQRRGKCSIPRANPE